MRPFVMILAALLFSGCDDHVLGQVTETGSEVTYAPDWAGVQDFFVDRCDSCHLDGDPFELREEVQADMADTDDSNNFLVVPGDCENSLLWQSVSWTGIASPMPFGASTPLPETTTAHICDWIENGAPL